MVSVPSSSRGVRPLGAAPLAPRDTAALGAHGSRARLDGHDRDLPRDLARDRELAPAAVRTWSGPPSAARRSTTQLLALVQPDGTEPGRRFALEIDRA